MKLICLRAFLLSAVGFVIILAACSTKPPPRAVAAQLPAPPPPARSAPPPVTASPLPGSENDFRVNVGDTVHFAFNQYEIEDSDKSRLQRQAQWLNRYPSVRITIEGHCDERGTREFNLALGARRANEVKNFLITAGVTSARIQMVSYGKERPICTQSGEPCWEQNRRGVTKISGAAGA